jgi:hypothetical protein
LKITTDGRDSYKGVIFPTYKGTITPQSKTTVSTLA